MPIYLRKNQVEQALADAARDGFRSRKRQLHVRWHDGGEVGHVEVLCAEPHAGASSDLLILSPDPLDVRALDSHGAGNPLHLVAWPDQHEGVTVRVVQSPSDKNACAHDVIFIPNDSEIFSRQRGLLETDLLRTKRALVCGVGSVGSMCAVELAKCGIGAVDLVDHDRLELHNVARHACGVSDLGRKKVLAVRDLLLDKNPSCQVGTHDLDVLENFDATERLVSAAGVVIVATDSNASRNLINAAALSSGRTAIYGRAMTRACSLDVIRVRPGYGPCYQCLIDTVLRGKREEISTPQQADAVAYADRPVVAEPGLANDLMPLSQLMTKLALQQLLQGMQSELRNLDEDLTADLFIWSNRRTEQQSGYEPMGTQASRPTILRWYGVDISQVPRCSLCAAIPHDASIEPAEARR